MTAMHEKQPPRLVGLGIVAIALRWLEELLSLVNGPLLMIGAGIAVVDLLTDGALTIAAPALLFAWAVSQALGIETQLLGCFARAREALRLGRGWSVAGWVGLGALLAFFAWQAGYVYAVMQAEHISEAQALSQLGIPAAQWLGERVALGVGLVALSGWTRYHPPAKASPSLADERAELERALELAPLRQRARAQSVLGAVNLTRQALAAARGREMPERLPTDPDSPTVAAHASMRSHPAQEPPRREATLQLIEPSEWRESKPRRRTASAETRVRRVLATEPDISTRQLAKRAHVSDSTASKHRALWRQEQNQGQRAQ